MRVVHTARPLEDGSRNVQSLSSAASLTCPVPVPKGPDAVGGKTDGALFPTYIPKGPVVEGPVQQPGHLWFDPLPSQGASHTADGLTVLTRLALESRLVATEEPMVQESSSLWRHPQGAQYPKARHGALLQVPHLLSFFRLDPGAPADQQFVATLHTMAQRLPTALDLLRREAFLLQCTQCTMNGTAAVEQGATDDVRHDL